MTQIQSEGLKSLDKNVSDHTPAGTWWICGLLFLATVLNYLDRQVLALTAERIMAEFDLSKEDLGKVISSFRYAYALFQIAGGWLVDAYGPRTIYPVAVGVWSLAGVLSALATSVGMLSVFRFMLGAGEAFNWPCALKVTQRLVPVKDRALANGIFNSGSAMGAMLAPAIVTFMAAYYGWRSAFVVTGALGALWVIGWLLSTRPHFHQLGGAPFSLSQILLATRRILVKKGFWLLAVSAIIVNSVSYFLADWIPLYLKTSRGFSFVVGNALSVAIYGSLEAGNILVGLLVRRLVSSGWPLSRARNWALFLSCILMSMTALAGLTPLRYLAVACLMLTALGVAGFLVIYLTLAQDLEPSTVGITSGLLGGLGNLTYGSLSPWIGRLLDLQETVLTFLLIGLLPWLAFVAIAGGMKTEQR